MRARVQLAGRPRAAGGAAAARSVLLCALMRGAPARREGAKPVGRLPHQIDLNDPHIQKKPTFRTPPSLSARTRVNTMLRLRPFCQVESSSAPVLPLCPVGQTSKQHPITPQCIERARRTICIIFYQSDSIRPAPVWAAPPGRAPRTGRPRPRRPRNIARDPTKRRANQRGWPPHLARRKPY